MDTTKDLHEVSSVQCDLCSYKWVAVRPKDTEKLECPNCNNIVNYENLSV
jgi:protein-arginine kinase activator protein McsA